MDFKATYQVFSTAHDGKRIEAFVPVMFEDSDTQAVYAKGYLQAFKEAHNLLNCVWRYEADC